MRFIYYIFKFITLLFSVTPFWLLYFLSDLLFLLFYHIIRYRKNVIKQNIDRSFPNLSKKEQIIIVKGFYHNLCDILIEGIKGFTITKKELEERYVFLNPELMNDMFDKEQDVISVGSHFANWEWGVIAAPLQLKHKLYALYFPLKNKYIDAYMKKSRNKFGTVLTSTGEVTKAFGNKDNKPCSYFFGADQSPAGVKGAHWMKFLNQDTACIKGPEFFARRYKMPVVYFDVQRVKRGYYHVKLIVLEADAVNTSSGEITENFMHTLEKIILKKPEDYLWSHKRWKHLRSENK